MPKQELLAAARWAQENPNQFARSPKVVLKMVTGLTLDDTTDINTAIGSIKSPTTIINTVKSFLIGLKPALEKYK